MTQTLCVIPSCRIPNRHGPGCDGEDCRGCLPRVATEGLCCDVCVSRAAVWLEVLIDWTADARLVAAGLVRRGQGAASGKPGSRPPINDGATDAMQEIEDAVTAMAREIAAVRGLRFVSSSFAGHWVADPLVETAHWLMAQLDWLRHAVDEQGAPRAVAVFQALAENAGRLRGLLDGPAAQRYLGPCGAPIVAAEIEAGCPVNCECHNGPFYACSEPGGCGSAGCGRSVATGEECAGNVYGRIGAQRGACRSCGATVDQQERRAWLDDEVRLHAYRRTEIAEAYGIKDNTITVWWKRGKLTAYWVTEAGLHVQWVELEPDPGLKGAALAAREREIAAEHRARGPKVFYLGDVLDLAAEDAARREERRAQRERRARESAA